MIVSREKRHGVKGIERRVPYNLLFDALHKEAKNVREKHGNKTT
jgi:hypothetical protein